MKAAMARSMVTSATTIPHFIYSEDIDVTDLLKLREQLKPEAEASGHAQPHVRRPLGHHL